MKKIGLIGGIGPESSIEYYRLIIKRFQEKLNTKDYPELMINSINMTQMLDYVFNNKLDKLVDFLMERINDLEKIGVDYIAIASNTPHIVFDKLAEKSNTPLVSIVEVTCKEVQDKKIQRVALFGTKSTMTNGFYNDVAQKYGINIVLPDDEKQDYIHNKYMTELVFNKIVPETKEQLIQIIRELKEEESIEGLILGGTELPLILKQSDFDDIKIFNTTEIHVESIVAKIIDNYL
ncbi:MAG: aspartate racemase [Porticoccaceae bacterium]|jgi:aspartate racemase